MSKLFEIQVGGLWATAQVLLYAGIALLILKLMTKIGGDNE